MSDPKATINVWMDGEWHSFEFDELPELDEGIDLRFVGKRDGRKVTLNLVEERVGMFEMVGSEKEDE